MLHKHFYIKNACDLRYMTKKQAV